MKPTTSSSSIGTPRAARTGERLIKRLCVDEHTLEKALALYAKLENVFKNDALPNVCAYLACEILGTEDVSWEAASSACGAGRPACFELWRSVRDVLSIFEPTVSFASLVRLYKLIAPESFINVLDAVKAWANKDIVFASAKSHDSILFAVFIWVCSILKVQNVTVHIIADDYDLEEDELGMFVETVTARCSELVPAITSHLQAVRASNGRLNTFIHSHGPQPPQLIPPKSPTSLKRDRGNDDDLLKKSPDVKRLNSGSSLPTPSRLDGIRRTASLLQLSAQVSSSSLKPIQPKAPTPIKVKLEPQSSPPARRAYVGTNPWKKRLPKSGEDAKPHLTSVNTTPTEPQRAPLPNSNPQSPVAQVALNQPSQLRLLAITQMQPHLKPPEPSPGVSSSASTLVNEPVAARPPAAYIPAYFDIPTETRARAQTQMPLQTKTRKQLKPPKQSQPSTPLAASSTEAHILHHIRKADWTIIAHIETFPCSDLALKLKILDLKTRIVERDKMPKDVHAGNSPVVGRLDQAIQLARDDIAEYVKREWSGEDENAEGGCPDIELKFKVLDLETRVNVWRKIAGNQN